MAPTSQTLLTTSAAVAAQAISRGELVVLPTETVFGVAALASEPESVRALAQVSSEGHKAWHAPTRNSLLELFGQVQHELAPGHRRVIQKLLPGPVTLAIELDADVLGAVRTALGVAPGVLDDGEALLVRVPNHEATPEVLAQVNGPVIATGVPSLISAQRIEQVAQKLAEAHAAGALTGITTALDRGGQPMGTPSSRVRLTEDGRVILESEGALPRRRLDGLLTRLIVFVCTGNTCRSPMAQAIAVHELKKLGVEGVDTEGISFASAGVATSGGSPASPEVSKALESLGIEALAHTSSPLTRELVERAEAVFGLTASHVAAIRGLAPELSERVRLLDASGDDVMDPIGQPQRVYDLTASKLQDLIRERLAALLGEGGLA